jgi:hypothetical protein
MYLFLNVAFLLLLYLHAGSILDWIEVVAFSGILVHHFMIISAVLLLACGYVVKINSLIE